MRQLIHRIAFFALLLGATYLFALVLAPFWPAIFWACVFAVIFFPLKCRLMPHLGYRANLSAACTLLIGVCIAVVPVLLISWSVVQQGLQVAGGIDSGSIDTTNFMERLRNAFPAVPAFLQNLGIDTARLGERLSESAVSGGSVVLEETLNFGQNTFSFLLGLGLMLYLTFFLLRDGGSIVHLVIRSLPLSMRHKARLFRKFAAVMRATVKGNLVIAVIQGTLGGLIFWFLGITAALLWGVVMAFLSLIPAIGAALVWLPAAIYFLATGDWFRGAVLLTFGFLIISLADNLLRPILVGRDTRIPDYIVLFSTVGGLALFGVTGFVAGPLIAALFLVLWDIYLRDFYSSSSSPGSDSRGGFENSPDSSSVNNAANGSPEGSGAAPTSEDNGPI